MFKNKTILLMLLAVVIAGAIAMGVVGCANKSGVQPAGGTNPSVTTNNGQPSGQPNQSNGTTRQFNPQQMQANVKNALAGLVTAGTITQDQANKVVQAYANRPQSSGQHGSYQQGTGQQSTGQRQNPMLTPLVSNGTLTQAQATAIEQAIRAAMPHRGQMPNVSTSGSNSTPTTTQ
jgi:polyhydroxyalkanoate synthesis regulator phasin